MTRLGTDHRLQFAHEVGIGVRADRRAQEVVDAGGIRNPFAHGFVDGRPQSLIARFDRQHFGAQAMHPINIRRLPFDVDHPHIDTAWQADPRTGGGGRDAMLARASLRNDALCTKTFSQQRLADGIIYFVCAGMREVFTLEPYLRTPAFAEARCPTQCSRASYPFTQLLLKLSLKFRAVQVFLYAFFQALKRRYEGFRHIAPAKGPEPAALIRQLTIYQGLPQRCSFVGLQYRLHQQCP